MSRSDHLGRIKVPLTSSRDISSVIIVGKRATHDADPAILADTCKPITSRVRPSSILERDARHVVGVSPATGNDSSLFRGNDGQEIVFPAGLSEFGASVCGERGMRDEAYDDVSPVGTPRHASETAEVACVGVEESTNERVSAINPRSGTVRTLPSPYRQPATSHLPTPSPTSDRPAQTPSPSTPSHPTSTPRPDSSRRTASPISPSPARVPRSARRTSRLRLRTTSFAHMTASSSPVPTASGHPPTAAHRAVFSSPDRRAR